MNVNDPCDFLFVPLVFLLLDILESEAKGVLLDIKHPAIKKQVQTFTWELSHVRSHPFLNLPGFVCRLWSPCCQIKTPPSHVLPTSHVPC